MKIWFERGFRAKPPGYELMKMFPPTAWTGYPGRNAMMEHRVQSDMVLLHKFYKKYPEVKYFPQSGKINVTTGGYVEVSHPAAVFVKKQRDLIKKGYTEQKAFEIVEEELGKFINQKQEEQRVLRGVGIGVFGESYLDRFQRVAEIESELKVKRLERDIPKYMRAQEEWVKDLMENKQAPNDAENTSYEHQSIEELLGQEGTDPFKASQKQVDPVNGYQPVLYQIVKSKDAINDKEGLTKIQEGFIERTERLLQIFHQRSHIHDGLKNLSDKEVILKVREGPNKLKKAATSFLRKLKKYNVKLDDHGEVDYSAISEQNIINTLKKNETLVKLTLMQADLEFEYPQKLEKMMVRSDMLKMIDEEELKMKQIAHQKQQDELSKKVLTYEEYYQASAGLEAPLLTQQSSGMGESHKDTTFEQFVNEKASKFIFDNDLLDKAYKFWENDEEKMERLKKIWLDLKRKNAIGGIDARTPDEHDAISAEIVDLTRKIRWKIDQELVRRNIDPLFKENYRAYDKAEFLIDADMEFFKIKKLLEKNPKVLKDDPLLSIDYMKIINLIKRKKLVENTSDHFNPADSIDSTYYDLDVIEREKKLAKERELERFAQNLESEQMGGGAGNDLNLEDEETDNSVRAAKKREEREKQKLLRQFDALANTYEKSTKLIANQKEEKGEGDAKKKGKKKKEKTLAAKLRLKDKKSGGQEKK